MSDFFLPTDLQPIRTLDRGTRDLSRTVHSTHRGGGTASMSIILESLLELLLRFYERDEDRRSELLDVIWKSLAQVLPCDPAPNLPGLLPLRSQYQAILKRLISVSQKNMGLETLDPSIPIERLSDNSYSRYLSEFEELQYIAKGGFGSVFRVRNKLDHYEYAIKKILLKCDKHWEKFDEINREVITLAKLSHFNIVSYKTAWIEAIPFIDPSVIPSPVSSSISTFYSESSSEISEKEYIFSNESSSHSIIFRDESGNNSNEDGGSKLDVSANSGVVDIHSSHRSLVPNKCVKLGAILYLQMELCEDTLRTWLDEREMFQRPIDPDTNMKIFTQILEGVSYIHSQGIIHRDLKPRNIFIRKRDNHVQIGDFGLAKEKIQNEVVPPESPLVTPSTYKFRRNTSCVGTHTYAAPEQMSQGEISFKSDIYSLGIILFELFTKFSTVMERTKAISELKSKSIVDEDLTKRYPQIAKYIVWLTSISSSSRPTARDLLDSEFSSEGQIRLSLLSENIRLKEKIQTQVLELDRYKSLVSERDKEILLLKDRLKLLTAQ